MPECSSPESKNSRPETAMAATAFPAATDAAVAMLRAGGNAVDAAVAAAWALAVCEPSGSGLGGKTVMLIRFSSGKSLVIDGHSRAPAAASRQRITRAEQQTGYLAATVPTTVATLGYAHRLYGELPLEQVMAPAIGLAEEGWRVTRLHQRQLKWCRAGLRASLAAGRLFLKKGQPYEEDDVFRQPVLAGTLRRLAQCGPDDFYRGAIARDIVEDLAKHGGLIGEQDLAENARPVEREPVAGDYRGHSVISVPPPGGGLPVLLALRVLEQCSPEDLRGQPERWRWRIAQVLQAVFRECDASPLTLERMTGSAMQWFLSAERAAEMFRRLEAPDAHAPCRTGALEGPGETTHVCAADGRGNVVSLTQSLQSLFGARVAGEKLGFLYNNCLRTCPRYPHPYQLAGRCIPRSNAAPTIVLSGVDAVDSVDGVDRMGAAAGVDGAALRGRQGRARPFLALGGAGSRRITSAVVQVISNIIDRGLSLAEAVSAPRVHVTAGGKVHLERSPDEPPLPAHWAQKFASMRVRPSHSYFMGAVQAIQFAPDGRLVGMADPRRDGASAGI
jgi:gamma-glutamyltranspeptidase/glutathione hydrolase